MVLVFITPEGLDTLANARRFHRDGIRRHFTECLTETDLKKLAHTLEKVRTTSGLFAPAASTAENSATGSA